MATEFIATVKSSGGDYTSLSAAEAGLQNDLTLADIKVFSISAASTPTIAAGDTVLGQTSAATGVCVLVNAARTQALIKTIAIAAFQSGEVVQKTLDAAVNVTLSNAGDSPIARIDCYAMADATAVTIDGWTTNATNYIKINVPDSDRHNGVWSTSAYRLSINGATALTVNEAYTRCEGLQIEDYGTAGYHNFVNYNLGNYFRFGYGIIRKTTADLGVHNGFYGATNGNFAYIYNTLMYDMGRFNYDDSGAGLFQYIYNCTAQNVTAAAGAFHSWGNRGVAKNCIAQDCTDGYSGNWDTTNSKYNNSDIASDAPGANSQTGEVTFTNEAGDDFSLAAGDAFAKDLGTDLSADAVFPFSDDIINVTRSDTWDIGAFAYITAGGGSSIQGVVAGVAATLGALVLGLALASSGICASTASCALSLGLDLRGSAQSSSTASCTIEVQAAPGATSIEGSTTAVSAANGSIGLGLRLQSEATSVSVAQGTLGLGLRLNSVVDGTTTAGLELRLGAGLGGTGAGSATGEGNATIGWVLYGVTAGAATTTCELGGGTAIIPATPVDYRVEVKVFRTLTNTACVERRAAVTVQVAQHAAIAVRAI